MSDHDFSGTVAPRSDQLNADDLLFGSITVTILKASKGSIEQPMVLGIDGERQPYKPGLSMRRIIIGMYGEFSSAYIGKSLTLFRDPAIRYGKGPTGGIRISHASGLDKPFSMLLTISRGRRAEYTVQPLVAADHSKVIAEYKASTPEDKETMWATLTPDQQVAVRAAMEA